jgi:hypothetical protein
MATLVKSVMLKIVANDGDTESKLDLISKKADELGRLHPDIKVKVDSAAASAKLAVLKRELKDTGDQSDDTRGRFGALGGALNLFATGGLSGGIGEMTMMQKVMAGLNLATGLAEPLIAGATVAVGGLAAGLTAAGAGAGIFGLVTKQVFSGISTNISAATAAENKMATAGSLKAQNADAKAFEATLKGLSVPQKNLVIGAANAESGWDSFVQQATAGVSRTLVPALNMVPAGLALMQPFLAPTEKAISSIIAKVQTKISSTSFVREIGDFAKASGPDLDKVAVAIGHVVMGLLGILHTFLPMSGTMLGGLDKITSKFETWGNTLGSHSGFKSMMSMFKSETPMAVGVLKQLAGIIKIVVSQMTGMSTFSNSKMLLQLALPILKFVDALLKAHPQLVWLVLYGKLGFDAISKLSSAFTGIESGITTVTGLGSKVSSMAEAVGKLGIGAKIAAGATKVWTGIQAAFDVVMDANPIALIVIGIAALIAIIVICVVKIKSFRDFWKDSWLVIKTAAADAWHVIDADCFRPIMKGVDAVVSFVKSHWKILATVLGFMLLGPVAGVTIFVATHWKQISSLTEKLVGDITGFFSRLGSDLFNAGAHIVSMLARGIESMAMAPVHAISSIVSDIKSFLPFSPAKRGPLSGAGSPDISGSKIPMMLAQGMDSRRSVVAGAAARMAGAASGGVLGAAAGRASAAQVVLSVGTGSGLDALFRTWLKNNIRVHGGNPLVIGA